MWISPDVVSHRLELCNVTAALSIYLGWQDTRHREYWVGHDRQTDKRTVWSRAYDLTVPKAAQTLQTKVNCSSQSSCRWELKKRVETFSVAVSTVRDWRWLPARRPPGRDKTRRAPSRSAGWLNLENVIAFVDDDCAQTAYETRSLVSRRSLSYLSPSLSIPDRRMSSHATELEDSNVPAWKPTSRESRLWGRPWVNGIDCGLC